MQGQAGDAVAAKAQALADGQQGAFRSLMKRLVPVTAYKRIPKLQLVRIQDMIAGFSVRRETNSSTEYLASLDFEFQQRAVRELLRSQGVPMVEDAAPPVVLVLAYRAKPDAGLPAYAQAGAGEKTWTGAWKGIDLEHAITPAKLAKAGAAPIHPDVINGLLKGDLAQARVLGAEYQSERIVLAVAEPSPDAKRLEVTLVGQDAVGWLQSKRSYRIYDGDLGYTAELAAVVSLGIIEGRWKALKSRPSGVGSSGDGGLASSSPVQRENGQRDGGLATSSPSNSAGGSDQVQLAIEFRGVGQWQEIRGRLSALPGVDDMEIAQLSARGASVSLRYPGGAERLAEELGAQGLQMTDRGGQWVVQSR